MHTCGAGRLVRRGGRQVGSSQRTDHIPTETQRRRWWTTRMRRGVGSKDRETTHAPPSTTQPNECVAGNIRMDRSKIARHMVMPFHVMSFLGTLSSF